MTNRELDKLLRSAPVPLPRKSFEDELSSEALMRRPGHKATPLSSPAAHVPGLLSRFGWALATVAGVGCAIALLVSTLGPQKGANRVPEPRLRQAKEYYNAIASLFPGQLRSIRMDRANPSLSLSEVPDVPPSEAVLIEIATPSAHGTFVVVTGQDFSFGGERYEVLLDQAGNVIVLGESRAWSSTAPSGPPSLKISAYRLDLAS